MASMCNFMHIIATFAAFLLSLSSAGFSPSSSTNVAVYWGQNSYGQSTSQQRLSAYCSNTDIDIIFISFLTEISSPVVNFANAGDNCTVFTGTTLLSCPQIEEDIQLCQASYNKTIMLSVGGATYTEGGFNSPAAAVSAANNVWAMFGPVQSGSTVKRPFGTATVDGFDFDFESSTQNMAPFATQLRVLMDAATTAGGKPYYLSAAPQCPYPDVADNDMLNGGVSFDFIQVQFYNNYCGVSSFVVGANTQPSYNLDTWDNWAKTGSANPKVKILVGIPANTGAGAGYTSGNTLQAALSYSQGFSSFGGVMMWDMSQLYKNPGFQEEVVQYLGSGGNPTPTSTVTTTTSSTSTTSTATTFTTTTSKPSLPPTSTTTTTTSTTTPPPGTGLPVPEWGQLPDANCCKQPGLEDQLGFHHERDGDRQIHHSGSYGDIGYVDSGVCDCDWQNSCRMGPVWWYRLHRSH
ncbi:Chitinase 2 [Diaporthe australafricana]|uniref:chitinase n=1 Tax=Diaporthe australafricana TaxID=127596 RepID=A0ABR3X9Y9_9PEZI